MSCVIAAEMEKKKVKNKMLVWIYVFHPPEFTGKKASVLKYKNPNIRTKTKPKEIPNKNFLKFHCTILFSSQETGQEFPA